MKYLNLKKILSYVYCIFSVWICTLVLHSEFSQENIRKSYAVVPEDLQWRESDLGQAARKAATNASKENTTIDDDVSSEYDTQEGVDKKWKAMVAERFRKRVRLLQLRCMEYKTDVFRATKVIPNLSYFSRNYDFFVCVSSKSACSTWKTHLLRMNGAPEYLLKIVHKPESLKRIRSNLVMDKAEQEAVKRPSATTLRVISVRHPIERLISAYNNKFFYGEKVVPANVESKSLRLIFPQLRMYKAVQVTFKQFLAYVIKEKRTKQIESMNSHWRPQFDICRPCNVPYDLVVKLETIDDDVLLITKELNITEVDITLRRNPTSSKENIYEKYFEGIPQPMIKEILDLYKDDFYVFDYEVPEVLLRMRGIIPT